MDNRFKYQRAFMIFNQEDNGFGVGQGASGFVKIEIKDGRGKLWVQVQNLKDNAGKFDYKAYLIKSGEGTAVPVYIGVITVDKNRGEFVWEFDPGSVGLTGIPIMEFNIAAVLVEYKDRDNSSVVCPLAAYKDKKTVWREKAKETLYSQKAGADIKQDDLEEILEKQDILSIYKSNLESRYSPYKPEPDTGAPEPDRSDSRQPEQEECRSVAEDLEEEEHNELNREINSELNEELNKEEDRIDVNLDNKPAGAAPSNQTWAGSDDRMGNGPVDAADPEKKEDGISEGGREDTGETARECAQAGGGFCKTDADGSKGSPCENCYMRCSKNAAFQNTGSLNQSVKLKEQMDRYFESCDPFNSRRRDYEWWKVGSPVHLNNVLYQYNISTPLLFNPKVLMAHFKYRHVIFGIYTDKMRRREYIVCGIPGAYGIDDRPFGEMCRWAQVEGNRPKYGAFGYWLIYMDIKTGKLLSV